MKAMCNASPLIYLAKMGRLGLLKRLFVKVFVSRQVFEETVETGRREGYSDAALIAQAAREGWVIVEDAETGELTAFAPELDEGEAATLDLAKKLGADIVIIDDASGRTVAKGLGLNAKGTVYVLLLAYRKKLLSGREAKQALAELVAAGFRLAPELYSKAINEIDETEPEQDLFGTSRGKIDTRGLRDHHDRRFRLPRRNKKTRKIAGR